MNAKQQAARWIGILLLAGSALFPAWNLSFTNLKTGAKQTESAGYHPLWSPPSRVLDEDEQRGNSSYQVNLLRTGIQLAVVLVLMNLGIYAFKTPAQNTPSA